MSNAFFFAGLYPSQFNTKQLGEAMEEKIIGLSLGADICWPAVYEELLKAFGSSYSH